MIQTDRLLLRPMQADDFDALLLIFTDSKVMAAFSHPPFTNEQMHHWMQRNLDHQQKYGYGLFSVILKSEGALIGNCGLEVMEDEGESVAELGYDFRSDYWKHGYATEAAIAVRDFAFGPLELNRLISLIRTSNQASARVAERVGMVRESEFKRFETSYLKYSLERENSGS